MLQSLSPKRPNGLPERIFYPDTSERDIHTRRLQKEAIVKDLNWQELASAPVPDQPAMSQNVPKCPKNIPHPPAGESPANLTSRQLMAIELLVQGLEDPDICRRIRIDRRTLYRWKYKNPLFKSHLRRRDEVWSTASDAFRKLLVLSSHVLHEQLRYGTDDSSFRAAYAILQLSNRFNPRRPSPPKQRQQTTNDQSNQQPITNNK